jgi:large subunit ribosomal protein L29
MDMKTMRGKSAKELDEHVLELSREQFNLRMQRGTGQLTKPHQLRQVRRDIARTKSLLGSKKKGS